MAEPTERWHQSLPDLTDDGNRGRLDAFNRHRPLLLSIAYRMLGSVADAEDIVQDTFVRWHSSPESDIRSPRAYLVAIVSRLCINHLQSARVRREQYVGSWLPEPVFTGDNPEPLPASRMDESLSMAFLLVLERLTPIERAVFLLRDVFDYEYREIARMIGRTEAACRQNLRRARQDIARERPRFRASSEQRDNLLRRFRAAASRGDMDGLLALLCDDVVLYADGGGKTTAVPRPIRGAVNVARFILKAPRRLLPSALVSQVSRINGQPCVVSYLGRRPHSVFSLDLVDRGIRRILIQSNPDKLSALADLPRHAG
jgi:RNA polymerase sigma-70 factor, ECF subfamily